MEDSKDFSEEFMKTASGEFTKMTGDEEDAKRLMDSYLARDALAYILRQFNPHARLGYLDYGQFREVYEKAQTGLFILIYVKHYKTDEDLVDKDPIWLSCSNLINSLATRIYQGRDRQLYLAELESRRQIVMQR